MNEKEAIEIREDCKNKYSCEVVCGARKYLEAIKKARVLEEAIKNTLHIKHQTDWSKTMPGKEFFRVLKESLKKWEEVK